MIHKLRGVLFFILLSCFSYAQIEKKTDSSDVSSAALNKAQVGIEPDSAKTKSPTEFLVNPTIGLGTGMFSFYGDLYNKHFQAPMVSRLAYDLTLSQRLCDYLQFNFYVLFGKLGADERFGPNNRNINFESQIRAGGINLEYNFDNFLPKDRAASPYISAGIESFEFLSKTDLFDKYGNKYYYWSDGSIRNKDETDANAGSAVLIKRDFKYESDVRELNLDGFGKYPERSFAIPVGAGVIFKINDFFDFKMGATMHFTFTDYIDGVTAKSVGYRRGSSMNDNFMMTSCAIRYNFGVAKSRKKMESIKNQENYKDVDFSGIDSEDEDKDGVNDFADNCPNTPKGVKVDAYGCPLDSDEDGVPDYKDDEKKSLKGAVVNAKGVTLSDSLINYQSSFYNDETGVFATIENRDSEIINENQKEYTVELGTFNKGLPPNLMTKFLSISDIASNNIHDSTTIYTAGKFDNYKDAEKRRQQLYNEGMTDVKVVSKKNGKYYDETASANKTKNNTAIKGGNTDNVANKNGVTSNNAISNNTANNTSATNNTSKNNATSDNAITKNTSANNAITNSVTKNNVTTSKTASNPATNRANPISNSDAKNNLNVSGLVFRIQLGAYKNKLSKTVFKNVKDLIEIKTDNGVYKYMAGSFTNMNAAAKHKTEMLLNGYPDAFIAAYKDGKRVSLQEVGATFDKKENVVETPDNSAFSGANKKLVTFKIQLGVFKNQPPVNTLAVFSKLKNMSGEKTKGGLTRYVAGSFNDYKEADAYKNDIKKMTGLSDVFIVALFNNEYISIKEAMELLK